jgi:penicillin-binding protein 2
VYRRRAITFLILVGLGLAALAVRLWALQILDAGKYEDLFRASARKLQVLPAQRGEILDRAGRILARDQACWDLSLDYRFLAQEPRYVAAQQAAIRRQLGVAAPEAARIYKERCDRTWQLVHEWMHRTGCARCLAEATAVAAGESLDPPPLEQTPCAQELPAAQDAVAQRAGQIRQRVEALRRLVGGDVREQYIPHAIVRGLDAQQRAQAQMRAGQTVGLSLVYSRQRVYPLNDVACHVIGTLGEVTAQEQARLNGEAADWSARIRNHYLDGDLIGRSGVEAMCESLLRGRRGVQQVEDSDEIGAALLNAPEHGQTVRLTIDAELQQRIARHFPAGRNGAVAVLDVSTGQVLALVSVPGYDLNAYRREYGRLAADEVNLPLYNRAVQRRYEPGSTAKPLAALAALAEGGIHLGWRSLCEQYLVAGHTESLKCTGHHGSLDVVGALWKSCNIFFYRLGYKLEEDRPGALCQWYRRLGLGQRPGTGLPEESAGNVPDRTDAAGARMLAIGQGELQATPLQVASAMATIARDGRAMTPTLLLDGPPAEVRDLGLRAEHVRAVRQGMHDVANVRGGTAYSAFHGLTVPPLPFAVSGKTGTAQTSDHWIDRNGNRRKDPDEIVHSGDWAWFAGYAPSDRPQVAFAVVVEYVDYEREGGGAANAGPVARELLRECLNLGHIRGDASGQK